jgi:uncharacterized membrane protein YqiK
VVTGHGAFVLPLFRQASFLTLAMRESEVAEQCVTTQGIALQVKAVIAFKVGNDPVSIVNAAQRFLSDQDQMAVLTGRIFAGHLRSIVGSMTVEEIVTERQKLAGEVLDGSKIEMARIGLTVDSLQIKSIDDLDSGYIRAMSAPHQAAIKQAAAIAESRAQQAAAQAQQEADRNQAQYLRDTDAAKAGYAAEVAAAQARADQAAAVAQQEAARGKADAARQTSVAQAGYDSEVAAAKAKADQQARVAQIEAERVQAEAQKKTSVAQAGYTAESAAAKAKSDQAGPLAAAEAQQAVLEQQAVVAAKNASLRQAQLIAEVIKPAEADAEKVRIMAKADAERTRIAAEAAASSNRIALDQALIAQMPDIIAQAAAGLRGSNLTVFNGAEGMTDLITQLAGQGMAVFDALRSGGRDSSAEQRKAIGERSDDGDDSTRKE